MLAAASRAFLAHGFERTSMDRIAEESGISRRTLYNQFESKKQLFEATVAFLWEGMPLQAIIDRVGDSGPPKKVLQEIGEAIGGFWAPDEAVAFARMTVAEGIRFPELVESFVRFGRGPARAAITRYLSLAHERGALSIPDLGLATIQFISLINGPLLWNRILGGGPAPDVGQQKRVVEEAVATFLARYSGAS